VLGATNNSISITNGGTLDLAGFGIALQPLIVSGAGAGGAGAIANSGGPVYDNGNGLAEVILAGNTTFGGPTRWDLGGSAGAVLSTSGNPFNVTLQGVSEGIYFEWMNVNADANLANINVMPGATLGDKGTTTLGNPAQSVNVFSNGFLTFYNSGGQNVLLNKAVLLYDGATMQNGGGATVSIGPITLGTNAVGAPGNCTFLVGSTSLTLSNALSGPGNLMKTGSSPLKLAGTNTYSGATMLNAGKLDLLGTGSIGNSSLISLAEGSTLDVSGRGDDTLTLNSGQTLQGTGAVNGKLSVAGGATLSPGLSGSGTLTVSNSVSLQGTTAMTLSVSTNTVLTAASIAYGGTLSLALSAGTPSTGNNFALFDASSRTGSFSAITPSQPGLGLKWDTNQLTSSGTLGVLALPRPIITSTMLSGKNLVFRGTNGTAGYSFRVLRSTNTALPFNKWAILGTNLFDANGNFAVTNSVAAPAQFFLLQAL
jgi:autotransporter-associated beta strand protein